MMKENEIANEFYWFERLKSFSAGNHWAGIEMNGASAASGYASNSVAIPGETAKQILLMCGHDDSNVFSFFLSSFQILISKYSGSHQVAVAYPSLQLPDDKSNSQSFLFALTTILPESTFKDIFLSVRNDARTAIQYQGYDAWKCCSRLIHNGVRSEAELFSFMFCYSTIQRNEHAEKFNMNLQVDRQGDEFRVAINYNQEKYGDELMGEVLGNYRSLVTMLSRLTSQPVTLFKLLTTDNNRRTLIDFQEIVNYQQQYRAELGEVKRVISPLSGKTLHELFQEQVDRTPESIALSCAGRELSYKTLDERSNQVAHFIQQNLVVKPDTLIALLVERSENMVVLALGILKAGAAYVPIDLQYPFDRVNYILNDARPIALFHDGAHAVYHLPAGCVATHISEIDFSSLSVERLPSGHSSADNLAYIIYTSGTTGNPKGVMVEHKSVVNLMMNEGRRFQLTPEDVWTLFHSIAFDFSVWEIWGALLYGGRLVVVTKQVAQSPQDFVDLLASERVTILNQTPGMFYNVAAEILQRDDLRIHLRRVIFGGEALNPALLKTWHEAYPSVKLINMYGITETTVHVTYKEIDASAIDAGISNIGTPIEGLYAYVMDDECNVLPPGYEGEIMVGGLGVSRGYLNRPSLTAERFIQDPIRKNARLYRSGDLGMLIPGGEIKYLGRKDSQVKIRGYRIELGEIEHVIAKVDGVDKVLVHVTEDGFKGKYLVAYFTGRPEVTEEMIRSTIATFLPDYMVPAFYVRLSEFPLTGHGKVDRRLLPTPGLEKERNESTVQTRTEEEILGIWKSVFGVTTIHIDDDFFELGGHSLLAYKISARIQNSLKMRIGPAEIFMNPTIRRLSRLVSDRKQTTLGTIEKTEPRSSYALSHAQQRLWAASQKEEQQTSYNMPGAYHLRGNLSVPVFSKAILELVTRHEILRTIFVIEGGEPRQIIVDPVSFDFKITYDDLRNVEGNRLSAARGMAVEEARTPFHLEKGPLVRARLIQIADEEFVFLFTTHHIVFDGWSGRIALREIFALYEAYSQNRRNPLTPLLIQYKDYAAWHNGLLQGSYLATSATYWKNKLSDYQLGNELPLDFIRPELPTFDGGSIRTVVSGELWEMIRTFREGRDSSTFNILVAVIKVLIYKLTGEKCSTLGILVAGREHVELESQIGFYVNTLVIKDNILEGDTFEALFERVKKSIYEAHDNHMFPFNMILEAVGIERPISRHPLFDVKASIRKEENIFANNVGIDVAPLDKDFATSNNDLTFDFIERDDQLIVNLNYNKSLFLASTARRILRQFEVLLQEALKEVTVPIRDLRMRSVDEELHALENFCDNNFSYPFSSVADIFREQAKCFPEAIALVSGSETLTYRELDKRSDDLAFDLQELGIRENVLVAIHLEKSTNVIVAILGVLKAGGAWLPLDASYPAQRVAYILEDAGIRYLITDKRLAAASEKVQMNRILIDELETNFNGIKSVRPLPVDVKPESLAYLIYTSGSTGEPKGVMISQGSLSHYLRSLSTSLNVGSGKRYLLTASISFSSSVRQILMPLCNGASLVIPAAEEVLDPDRLMTIIGEKSVTSIDLVPSHFHTLQSVLLQSGRNNVQDYTRLREIFLASEPIMANILEDWWKNFDSRTSIYCMYGQTETTGIVSVSLKTSSEFNESASAVSVGKSISGVRLYLLDQWHHPVGVDEVGEVYVGGATVGSGYKNNTLLDRQKFLHDCAARIPDVLLYRTGDLGRISAGGDITILKRKDDQFKVRGFLVEPSEVNRRLVQHPLIRYAVVVAAENEAEEKVLVAYYTSESEIPSSELRSFLLERLPGYMIPADFVQLDKIPTTSHGKVDLASLRKIKIRSVQPSKVSFPSNEIENELLFVWKKILKRESIRVNNDFFEIGGDSLKAAQLGAQIFKIFSVRLNLGLITKYRTIEKLAKVILSSKRSKFANIPRVQGAAHLPVSHAQKRLWLMSQFSPASTAFNMPDALDFTMRLNVEAFQKAVYAIVERHDILRTTFYEIDGSTFQKVHGREHLGITLEYTDLREDPEKSTRLRDLVKEHATRVFDLSRGPLIALGLVRMEETRFVFLLNQHHIISDAWSKQILMHEILTAYEDLTSDRPVNLPALPVQYADFAAWQNSELQTELIKPSRDFWLQKFSGVLPELKLPTDHPRPAQISYLGKNVRFSIGGEAFDRLVNFAESRGMTLYSLTVAGIYALMYHYTGQTDLVIGSPVAGRNHPDLEGQMGLYLNTVPIRTQFQSSDPVDQFFTSVKESVLTSLENQFYPFDMLLDDLGASIARNRNPLFDVGLNFNNVQRSEDTEKFKREVNLSFYDTNFSTAKADLWFNAIVQSKELRFILDYNSDLFKQTTVEKMVEDFLTIMQQLDQVPQMSMSQLSKAVVLAAEERSKAKMQGSKNKNLEKLKTLALSTQK